MTLQFPKVHSDSLNKVFVSFYIGGKRYRLYNGKRINSTTDPNSYPIDQRLSIAKVLAAEIYSYLLNDGILLSYRSTNVVIGKLSDLDYFKTLWSRYKKQTELLKQGQTLYSFRHSGAIEIYKRTGSLSKLQTAMGHSSLNVSLTYLRGLEIAELKEEDMPLV